MLEPMGQRFNEVLKLIVEFVGGRATRVATIPAPSKNAARGGQDVRVIELTSDGRKITIWLHHHIHDEGREALTVRVTGPQGYAGAFSGEWKLRNSTWNWEKIEAERALWFVQDMLARWENRRNVYGEHVDG